MPSMKQSSHREKSIHHSNSNMNSLSISLPSMISSLSPGSSAYSTTLSAPVSSGYSPSYTSIIGGSTNEPIEPPVELNSPTTSVIVLSSPFAHLISSAMGSTTNSFQDNSTTPPRIPSPRITLSGHSTPSLISTERETTLILPEEEIEIIYPPTAPTFSTVPESLSIISSIQHDSSLNIAGFSPGRVRGRGGGRFGDRGRNAEHNLSRSISMGVQVFYDELENDIVSFNEIKLNEGGVNVDTVPEPNSPPTARI